MGTAATDAVVATRRYRFAGVVVDEAAARMVVDGRPCACSQRALKLLLLLCESPGRTLPRLVLLDRLWPGGQVVGDEALTQAVFRARACLGRYADCIVTVRGVGFRLDAQVDVLGADQAPPFAVVAEASQPLMPAVVQPSGETSPARGGVVTLLRPPNEAGTSAHPARRAGDRLEPVQPAAASGARARPLRGALSLLALILLLFAGWQWWARPAAIAPPERIDQGYGLVVADLHGVHPESPQLLREAFAHEGRGDRARARALLETVHGTDPATPIPALFLALFAVGGDDLASADRWLVQATNRIAPLGDPYVAILLAYVRAERAGNTQEILRHAGAALDLRPDAWQMRLARAHLLLASGYRDAARAELAAIDFQRLDHRKLYIALADRASLGDVEEASALLARLARGAPPSAQLSYLQGRIAWSARNFDAAVAAFNSAVEQGRAEARFDLLNRSLANLGAIAVMRGDFAAATDLLERARQGMLQSGWRRDEIDLSLMLAQLHALDADAEGALRELARAEQVVVDSGSTSLAPLVQLHRHRLDPGTAIAGVGDPVAARLLQGYAALRSGDRAAARSAATDTLRQSPLPPGMHDEARLLAALAGAAPGDPVPVDPPYPPLARLTTQAAVARLANQDVQP